MTDIIIIGAGLAGLNAARKLEQAGKSVQVIEARDRVGGRNVGQVLEDGNVLEMGGQWIGPVQTRIYELCKELGLEIYPTYNEGKNLFYLNGKRKVMKPKKEAAPPFNIFELLDLDRAVKKIHKMMEGLDLKEPWKHPKAKEWDSQTYESWIQRNPLTARTKAFLRLLSEAVFSTESTDFSFLHFLFYIKAGKDIETLISVDRGAQQERVVGGTQLISKRIAASLKNEVELNCPVHRIEQNEEGVIVYSGTKSWTAKKAIVAIPPTLAGRISYDPVLPPNRDQLTQRVPMGTVIKIQVVYKTPFWRKDGWTGQVISFEGPVKVVFDNSPKGVDYGVLLCFIEANDGRIASEWTLEKRKTAVIDSLEKFFGEEAKNYEAYYEKNWAAEPYSRGCYGGHFSPGVWTGYGKYLR
ncbi:MAG: FAD-dependent oxidoreductase, partial [Bacteroidota bacterium]